MFCYFRFLYITSNQNFMIFDHLNNNTSTKLHVFILRLGDQIYVFFTICSPISLWSIIALCIKYHTIHKTYRPMQTFLYFVFRFNKLYH